MFRLKSIHGHKICIDMLLLLLSSHNAERRHGKFPFTGESCCFSYSNSVFLTCLGDTCLSVYYSFQALCASLQFIGFVCQSSVSKLCGLLLVFSFKVQCASLYFQDAVCQSSASRFSVLVFDFQVQCDSLQFQGFVC